MPFVTERVIEGVFDDLRKRELVEHWYMVGPANTTQDVLAVAGATPVG